MKQHFERKSHKVLTFLENGIDVYKFKWTRTAPDNQKTEIIKWLLTNEYIEEAERQE